MIMTAFDAGWSILKMPYLIEGDTKWPHDVLYQGGQEGDEDSTYWTPNRNEALVYALFGSNITHPDLGPRRGLPQIRVSNETDEEVVLPADYEGTGAAHLGNEKSRFSSLPLPHTFESRERVLQSLGELMSEIRTFERQHGDTEDWKHGLMDDWRHGAPSNTYWMEGLYPFNETTARFLTMPQRIEHIQNAMEQIRSRLARDDL